MDTECIIWTGRLHAEGYGLKGDHFVHRLAYKDAGGVLIKGMVLDHLCRNRACINPKHLEQVTNKENILRGEAPSAKNKRKTHCPYGHPYDSENTFVTKTGARICRKCSVRRAAERYKRKKAE